MQTRKEEEGGFLSLPSVSFLLPSRPSPPGSSPFFPVCFLGADLEGVLCFISIGGETGVWEDDNNVVKHAILSRWC